MSRARDHPAGARLRRRERQPARAAEREHVLLDRPLVARVEPALDRRQQAGLELVRARLRARLDDEVDVDLEVARADRRLHPVSVAARLGERLRDRRLADAEEAQRPPARRLRAREQRAERVRLERVRPEPLQLGGRAREHDDDAPLAVRDEQAGRGAGEPERDRAVGHRRLLRHPGREVGIRPLEPLGSGARDRLDPLLELRVDVEPAAERARDHLDRPVVVRRAEPAGDEARVGLQPLSERRLELGRGRLRRSRSAPARARCAAPRARGTARCGRCGRRARARCP